MTARTTRIERWIRHRDVVVPTFIYGTAWKEERTTSLTRLALQAGFRGIDSANQRRHYHEAGVGQAVAGALADGLLIREALFLQTKFTYAAGQDHRLPYDPRADYTTQVRQSVERSLIQLETTYVDGLLLHGPAASRGLTAADQEVWRAMEQLQAEGAARLIGVSNVSYEQLALLHDRAQVKPAFVQNRCFARNRWDARVRAFCRANDILYQGFSLLTANAVDLNHHAVFNIARRTGRTVAQVVFRFALQVGMIPLTGTTDALHMQENLAVYDFELTPEEVERLELIAV